MIKIESLELLKELCIFDNPAHVYVILAVARKKYNPTLTHGTEIVFREIIREEKQIERNYTKIKLMIENYRDEKGNKYNFHMYVTVNPRDVTKALKMMKEYLALWEFEQIRGCDNLGKFKRIDSQWYSCLMKPECKGLPISGWLIDIDEKDKMLEEGIKDFLRKLGSIVLLEQETTQGKHLLVTPFNMKAWDASVMLRVEVKKDALFFLEKNGDFK